MWIPAYFRDCFLAGLMRTTSRSESENHFFTSFTNAHLTLVEFNMRFETALDGQRHAQGHNDTDSKYSKPTCKTPLKMEMHASEMFTRTLFYEVQKQIVAASFFCGVKNIEIDNEKHTITVEERFETHEGCETVENKVVYNSLNNETVCNCKKFNRIGVPCRHMILVWKEKLMTKFHEKYILNRWTILAAKQSTLFLDNSIIEECARTLDKKRMLNSLWSELHLCVTLVEDDEDNLTDLIKKMKELRTELEARKKAKICSSVTTSRKIQDIEMLMGTTLPTEIIVKEPKIAKNKGSGVQLTKSEKRLKSGKEKAIEKNNKRMRNCKGCGKLCTHDQRNGAKITAQVSLLS
ncbi:hypothetical protein M5689_006990 [Euphorbia peplus]|nr:hypothetical protein M5689_006990 [Euphorbia peplus]